MNPNQFMGGYPTQVIPPIYPNYNYPQPTQIDRYAQNQQLMAGTQMSVPNNQLQSLNGRIVDDFNLITANDVPMDGIGAIFIKRDGSEIQVRNWAANGTISMKSYKPSETNFDGQAYNLSKEEKNLKFDLSDASTEAFMKRFDDISERIEKIEKNFGKTTTSRAKKEVDAE